MRFVSVGLLLAVFAAVGQAQTTAPSTAEQMLNDMLKPGPATAQGPATRPQPAPILQPSGYTSKPGAAGLLREGSDVIARRGHLVKGSNQPYSQFVFDKSQGLSPMFVLPNLQLMSMEDASAATKEDLSFTVSGMVTEYRGKNYIILEPGPEALARQTSTPVATVQPDSHGSASADQLLKEMLSTDKPSAATPAQAGAPLKDSTSGSAAVAPNAPLVTVLPEQSQIFDRVCRLSLCPDGLHEELTFESDGSSLRDPPMIVLPNLKLVDLEKAAGDHNTRMRVTGTVTEYRGRNYIILQKVVVMADSDRQL